jgi:hypothetical protein
MPVLWNFDAVCRCSLPAYELEPVLTILPGLRPRDLRRSTSRRGDHPLTWYADVNPKPSLRRSQELPGSGGLRCGLGGSLCSGVDAFAFDAVFRTAQSSCTAIPCSSIAQDSSETAIPHIQQVKGGSEPDTTMRLQLAPIDPSRRQTAVERNCYIAERTVVCLLAHISPCPTSSRDKGFLLF